MTGLYLSVLSMLSPHQHPDAEKRRMVMELQNLSFEGSRYANGMGNAPEHWVIECLHDETFPGGDRPAQTIENQVPGSANFPPAEVPVFILDGNRCLKIFKAKAPMYAVLHQTATGLTPGEEYEFAMMVHPDIVDHYDGSQKVYDPDVWAAEARVGYSTPGLTWPRGQDKDGGMGIVWGTYLVDDEVKHWFNINNGAMQFGQYRPVTLTFIADAEEVEIWLELKAKWGGNTQENNWFLDKGSFVHTGTPPDPDPPPEGEEYDRIVVLCSPTTTVSEEHALLDETIANRRTFAHSAQDAINVDWSMLKSNTIIAHKPEGWTGNAADLKAWIFARSPQTVYKVYGETEPEPPDPDPPPPDPPNTSQVLITPHVQSGVDEVLGFLSRLHTAGKAPAVIKLFNWGDMSKCHAAAPNIGFLLRRYWDGDIQGTWINVPEVQVTAYDWVDNWIVPGLINELDVVRSRGWNGICWVEVDHNEIFSCNNPLNPKARDFSTYAAHRLMEHNIPNVRPAIGSFPVGNPEIVPPNSEVVSIVLPMARAVEQYGGVMTYHSYWAYRDGKSYLFDPNQFPYLAGRWAEMDKVLVANGCEVLWLPGEMGVTHGDSNLRPTPYSGWRDSEVYGGDFEPYAQELVALNSFGVNWNNTHGGRCVSIGCIFTRGGGSKWQLFEMKQAQFDYLATLFGG